MNTSSPPPDPHSDHAEHHHATDDHAHFSTFSVLGGGIGPRVLIAGGASLVLWAFIAWALK